MSSATRIDVVATPGGVRCHLVTGALSPRRLRRAQPTGPGRPTVRVALVAASALLLAGDEVRIDVVVEGAVCLDVLETAGTVAYDMRGGAAGWHVTVALRQGAQLIWGGEPFVVADGADVDRSFFLDMEPGCLAAVRESLVLGRNEETGGELRTSTRAFVGTSPVLVEDLDLGTGTRHGWAVLGSSRCLETVSTFGVRLPEAPGTLQSDLPGSTVRVLGDRLHLSRDAEAWAQACAAVTPSPAARL